MIAEAENQSAIAATWQTAMSETDATFDALRMGIAAVPPDVSRVRSSAA